MALKSQNKITTEFSTASMSDLVFLLLIFFVLTSTLVSPLAHKLNLPKGDNQINNSTPIVAISIDANLNYYVDDKIVSLEAIRGIVNARINGEEEPTVKLHADKTVPIDNVVKIMNMAKDEEWRLVLALASN